MKAMHETATVECLSCREEVQVKIVPYENGYIAVCPKCKKLAYNSSKKPPAA